MKPPFLHPRTTILVAFADGELVGSTRARVADHLASCPRCQSSLGFLRGLERTGPDLLTLPVPADLKERILQDRSAHRGVLLPFGEPAEARPRVARWVLRIAAVAATFGLAIIGLRLIRPVPLVAAGAESQLSLVPSEPRLGQEIQVRYRPVLPELANQRTLVLRARLRTPAADTYDEGATFARLGTLVRTGKAREFQGTLRLPDSVVFAALAVELEDSTVVDDRNGRGWEVLVHDASGRPTLPAVLQRVNDLFGRNWEEAFATSRRATELYPDDIRSWILSAFLEKQLGVEHEASSRTKQELDRLTAAAKATRTLSGEELAALWWTAYVQRDSAGMTYWYDRMTAETPFDPDAAPYRVIHFAQRQLATKNLANIPPVLEWLDSLWIAMQPTTVQATEKLSGVGLELAGLSNDEAAYLRWSDRRSAAMPWQATIRAAAVSQRPALRQEGMERLRSLLTQIGTLPRQLEHDRREHQAAVAEERRRALVALGRGLVETGNLSGGIDTLRLASVGRWNLSTYRSIARAMVVAGDAGGASEFQARIVADPRASDAEVDSLTRIGTAALGREGWNTRVAAMRREMLRSTLERSVRRPVLGGPTVDDSSGRRIGITGLGNGSPSVVVFWSRYCPGAIAELPEFLKAAERLAAQRVPLVLVVEEPRSAGLSEFLAQHNVTVPVYHDARKEAMLAFGNWGTPSGFVVDGLGRIRYADEGPPVDLVLLVAAVLAEGK